MLTSDIKQLVLRSLGGETSSFDQLVAASRVDAARVARKYLGASDDVDDILQDSYSQAYLRLPDLESPERFQEWLRTIVRNRCLSHLRRRGRDVAYHEVADHGELQVSETMVSPSPEEGLLLREQQSRLRSAIDRLSPAHRSVTTLHYIQDRPYDEIAQTASDQFREPDHLGHRGRLSPGGRQRQP